MGFEFRSKLGTTLLVLVAFLLCSVGAWAQAGTGELTGVVTDQTGAVVPKVQVKLTNTATGIVRTATTTDAGIYAFTALPIVGTYTLHIEAPGFKPVNVKDIVINVGSSQARDIKLAIGSSEEVVNVEAGAQLVQTTESQVSTLVDQRVWQSMPLEVRNQNEFINLVAGAVPDDVIGNGGRGAAVNGARTGSGNYLVEGVDNNDQGQGGRGQLSDASGGAATGISPEAIQEYRVITNSFAAEYGKAGGFVTDTVLKSGTNQYHGSLFEYNRVQALAANSWHSNNAGEKDSLVRNQFGGSFGGAIVKDKTFFHTAVELHRMRQGQPIKTVGVTQQFLDWVNSGQMASFVETELGLTPGALANSRTLGPIFNRLKAKGPFPLGVSNGDPGNYVSQGFWTEGLEYPVPIYGDITVIDPSFLNENRWSLKVDHKLGNNDQLSGAYLLQSSEQGSKFGGGDAYIGPNWSNPGRGQNLSLTWTHTFSPTILYTAKAGYLRHTSNFPSTPGFETTPSIYTIDSLGVGFGNTAGFPQFFTDNLFQVQNHLSFVKGKHNFKTGGEYRRTRNGSSFQADKNGEYAPWSVEDLVTDLWLTEEIEQDAFGGPVYGSVYQAIASVDPTTGKAPEYYRGYRANEIALYFQDDWRATNRLTLNWGIRYEYFGVPHNYKPGLDSNFYFGVPTTPIATTSTNPFFPKNSPFFATVATGSFQQRDHEIWNKDTNNFSPRFGFAYDVFGTQKLVFRGGVGVMYDRIYNNLFENIRFNYPYFSYNTYGYAGNTAFGPISYPGLYTDSFTEAHRLGFNASPLPAPRHMDQNLVTPYYEQFNLGFQYEFVKGYVLESSYIGTMGRKLTGIIDINTFNGRRAAGQSSTRINPTMAGDNFRTNAFGSNYHGWQTTVRKSYSNGLSFQTSYTYSKALDSVSDAFNNRSGARPTNNMNPGDDYGPADFDLTHRLVTNYTYDLPFFKGNSILGGWTINGIVSIQTGTPFSPYSSASSYDANKDGYFTDRYVTIGGAEPNSTVIADQSPGVGYFDTTKWGKYTCPASVNGGAWCQPPLGRNSMRGPGFANVDFGVSKAFKITEGTKLTFMGNFFNLFNRANFNRPVGDANNADFGKSVSTFDPRVTQLALRLDF